MHLAWLVISFFISAPMIYADYLELADHGPGLLLTVAGLSLFRAFNHPIFSTGVAPLLALVPREHSNYSGERENRHRDTTPEWWTPARHGREGREETRVKTLEGQRKPIADHRATG